MAGIKDQFRSKEESPETGEHAALSNQGGLEERGPAPGPCLAQEKVPEQDGEMAAPAPPLFS